MVCPTCVTIFEPAPWPATHQIYCSRECMKRAYYLRNKEAINAKAKQWCVDNRELRLEVQRRWNAKPSAKAMKKAWQRKHYKEWYSKIRENGEVRLISARMASREALTKANPIKKCVASGEHEGRIECHHKDGNPFNTVVSNLEWMCLRHHRMRHGKYRQPKPSLGVRGLSRLTALIPGRMGS